MPYYSGSEITQNALSALSKNGAGFGSLLPKKVEITISQGSHQVFMSGHFTSVMWSDEGGIQFFIDVPEYRGRQIRYITVEDRQWSLRLEDDPDVINRMDDGEELCEIEAMLDRHRFVPIASLFVDGVVHANSQKGDRNETRD